MTTELQVSQYIQKHAGTRVVCFDSNFGLLRGKLQNCNSITDSLVDVVVDVDVDRRDRIHALVDPEDVMPEESYDLLLRLGWRQDRLTGNLFDPEGKHWCFMMACQAIPEFRYYVTVRFRDRSPQILGMVLDKPTHPTSLGENFGWVGKYKAFDSERDALVWIHAHCGTAVNYAIAIGYAPRSVNMAGMLWNRQVTLVAEWDEAFEPTLIGKECLSFKHAIDEVKPRWSGEVIQYLALSGQHTISAPLSNFVNLCHFAECIRGEEREIGIVIRKARVTIERDPGARTVTDYELPANQLMVGLTTLESRLAQSAAICMAKALYSPEEWEAMPGGKAREIVNNQIPQTFEDASSRLRAVAGSCDRHCELKDWINGVRELPLFTASQPAQTGLLQPE